MAQRTTSGQSTLDIHRMGLGCMGMSEFYGSFDEKESIETLHKAIDLGVNFFDTADMQGSGANDNLFLAIIIPSHPEAQKTCLDTFFQ